MSNKYSNQTALFYSIPPKIIEGLKEEDMKKGCTWLLI